MPVSYATPGVYVEEVDRGTKPIEGAGTSITAFMGISAEASIKKLNPDTGDMEVVEKVPNRAMLVTNWTQYQSIFGGFLADAYLPDAVYGYFANGGGACYVTSLHSKDHEPQAAKPRPRTKKGESEEAAPKDPPAPATPIIDANAIKGDATDRTGLAGLEVFDDISLIVCPDIWHGYDHKDKAQQERIRLIQTEMITHCENMQYRFALLDTPPGLSAQQALEWRQFVNFDTAYAAMYYPWIEVADYSDRDEQSKMVPPSGHVVGIYNRADAERGVHKAPANEVVLGAVDLELNLTKGEQGTLNPKGINCIRAFPGRGIRVWGARTLSSDGSWRYINVRRLFNFVGSSLDTGLQWVVFEPNDQTLWAKVSRDISAFLKVVWRSGALFGTTPDKAFYVKVDEEINPPEIRDLGQLIIEVGLAPVKPAEFVILRISQWAGADAEE
ncbi:MAG: phage tail sheath family protein [Anaerolineales bacterium]|nr:phage tail sheath family protein [Anaerolineales bacterium]